MSITLLIVIITVIVSITGFARQNVISDMIFYPYGVKHHGQYHRFLTHGLVHADAGHLIFNMIALYSFGENLETIFSFDCIFGGWGKIVFILLYVSALIVASLPDYVRYGDNQGYSSLGASGAVSAIVFATILFFPQARIGVIFLPLRVPGYLFGLIYLAISAYLDKRGGGSINHSAHFWGAVYGVVFTLVACQLFAQDFQIYQNFIRQLHQSTDELLIPC